MPTGWMDKRKHISKRWKPKSNSCSEAHKIVLAAASLVFESADVDIIRLIKLIIQNKINMRNVDISS